MDSYDGTSDDTPPSSPPILPPPKAKRQPAARPKKPEIVLKIKPPGTTFHFPHDVVIVFLSHLLLYISNNFAAFKNIDLMKGIHLFCLS
jgi:hypothetical protein